MAKYCCSCNKSLGFFSVYVELANGFICNSCLSKAGIERPGNKFSLSTEEMKSIVSSRSNIVKQFRSTHDYDDIDIDLDHKLFKVEGNIFHFSNLLSYKYDEQPINPQIQHANPVPNGSMIGGIIGGIGGGLVGTLKGGIVGGVMGSIKGSAKGAATGAIGAGVGNKIGSVFSGTCEHMKITLRLVGTYTNSITIDLIYDKTKYSSSEYKEACKSASSCMEGLALIAEHNKSSNHEARAITNANVNTSANAHIPAEQIAKELEIYESLLKKGILTKEEFDAKKKQLLSNM